MDEIFRKQLLGVYLQLIYNWYLELTQFKLAATHHKQTLSLHNADNKFSVVVAKGHAELYTDR